MSTPPTTMRSTCWSVTVNNPTAADEEQINFARQRGWRVEGQLEKGSEGTPHYQLRVTTPQVRFSALKKAFPRGHIEAARDPVALGKYVTKEVTRVSGLPTGQDAYPSLSKFWDLIYQYLTMNDKEGLNLMALEDDTVLMYKENDHEAFLKTPLVVFDLAVRDLIKRGYHVEALASNPSTRSMWKLYAAEIVLRSRNFARIAAQSALETDRQTDSVNLEQNIMVPEITDQNGHALFLRQEEDRNSAPSSPGSGCEDQPSSQDP